jgi:hypothetical protein
MRLISWADEELVVSEEGFFALALVTWLVILDFIISP